MSSLCVLKHRQGKTVLRDLLKRFFFLLDVDKVVKIYFISTIISSPCKNLRIHLDYCNRGFEIGPFLPKFMCEHTTKK